MFKPRSTVMMPRLVIRTVMMLCVAMLVADRAARKPDLALSSLSESAPFSKTLTGSGDIVCWSVKRALLSQGYMLDNPEDSSTVLTGTREFQPQHKLNVAIRLQATCADNRNGTSIVFVIATREDSRLEKMRQSTTAGIGPAMITVPTGSAKVLGVVGRETISDPAFYNRFFQLVADYVAQDEESHPAQRAARAQ
ncbi:MAG: DUF2242 domain-containing protein [Steroidobacteraceae bacterium]